MLSETHSLALSQLVVQPLFDAAKKRVALELVQHSHGFVRPLILDSSESALLQQHCQPYLPLYQDELAQVQQRLAQVGC